MITGSGNLTERGLGQKPGGQAANWEAFSTQSLEGETALAVEKEISDWLQAQAKAETLCSLDDPRVLEKAMANARVRYNNGLKAPAQPKAAAPKHAAKALAVAAPALQQQEILIRELPSTRGGQGDIGQTAHRHFFGHDGTDKFIFTQYVELDGTLHAVKKVWLFYNAASNNYRLELPESKGQYEVGPNDERMILIAAKLDERSFRYTILRPITNQPAYKKVRLLFGPHPLAGRRLMKESYVSPDLLRDAWDDAPIDLLPISLPTAEP
ncbi:hypothetical protein GCM10008066_17610 [Oxalicibacterium faecigallinarum]|uniref:Phospholipase D-like domain-containing protein n=1 Tax=Oxalicibacterium faecigallinarum TaxID=573741 RepID=A0A8J3F6G9_9BURK|nr:hypothetical protein GCM10008066_17610 [Oxalicibacterium faecigallinarum]